MEKNGVHVAKPYLGQCQSQKTLENTIKLVECALTCQISKSGFHQYCIEGISYFIGKSASTCNKVREIFLG